MAATFFSISARLPAMVTSSMAWVSWPFSIRAGDAARIVASHGIEAEAHQAGDVKSGRNSGENLLWGQRFRLQIEISAADSRRTHKPARGVVGGFEAQFASAVGIQQVAAKNALIDHYSAS